MEESWDQSEDIDELDVFESAGGSAEDARQAGDDAVAGLDKITAQMPGGEHRPEQQEMCRAVAEALVTRTHLVVQAGTGTGKSLVYLIPPRSAARRFSSPPPPRRLYLTIPGVPPSGTSGAPAVGLVGNFILPVC